MPVAATWDAAVAAGGGAAAADVGGGVSGAGAAAAALKHIMFVGQLPYDATVPMIVRHFQACAAGSKIKVRLLTDKHTGTFLFLDREAPIFVRRGRSSSALARG